MSKRLQSSLELYDRSIWPLPKPVRRSDVGKHKKKTKRMRKALDERGIFGVSMHSNSREGDLLDPYLNGLVAGKENATWISPVNAILSLRLENIGTDRDAPRQARQTLLSDRGIGLEGVEAIIQGRADFGEMIKRHDLSCYGPIHQISKEEAAESVARETLRQTASMHQWWIFFGVKYRRIAQKRSRLKKSRWLWS
ncbi:MAG: hypothetical protein Q9217_004149 [Psora testacea]